MNTPLRIRRTAALAALVIAAAACGTSEPAETTVASSTTEPPLAAPESLPEAEPPPQVDAELSALLEGVVAETELPAVGVTVFDSDTVIETAIAGVRRRGDSTAAQVTDKFSIGSNTKAMTATLVAMYVDEGLISWDTTVEDVYADELESLDSGLSGVTVRQLLNHTAGIDDELAYVPLLAQTDLTRPVVEQRLVTTEITLARPAHHPTGQYEYSNVGYTLVGGMLEQLTGMSWEDQIQARLFDPLGMDSCGFYAPGTPGEVDQPWGHFTEVGGEPMDPGDPDAEYPHVLAPAGMVHCSMADWTVFLQSQLRGFQGQGGEIISPEAFAELQTPPESSDYALGWVTMDGPDGIVLTHDGSNDRFMSEAWLIPGRDWGVLAVTNLGEVMATPAIRSVVDAAMARHLAPQEATDRIADPVKADSPPPTSFAEVDADYTAAHSAVLADGRNVVAEFLAGDIDAVHARLNATAAAELPAAALQEAFDQMTEQAPLEPGSVDRAFSLSPSSRLYLAELDWGGEKVSTAVSFDGDGMVSGLSLNPQQLLPADPAADHRGEVEYRLPFDGLWHVTWGGNTDIQNYHVTTQDQRHALDILVWKNGATHRGDGSANEDYWAYGQPVLAPAAGTVVTVVDGLPDETPRVGSDPVNAAGNHIVIEVAEGEYVLIAHMQPASVTVAEGDLVASGQQIGLVGNSGNTSEPHIHIHAQDRPEFDHDATGLPIEFRDYFADGQMVDVGQPTAGHFVVNG